MNEVALRSGGLPLLPEAVSWPHCPRCEAPMLFRAQIPLSLASLVAFDDPRLLLVFECHATGEHSLCDHGEVLIVQGNLAPRTPPQVDAFDVVLLSLGNHPERVARIVRALSDRDDPRLSLATPYIIAWAAPASIATEAVRGIREAGGGADLRPHPPTVLEDSSGGQLVPFDDDVPGTHRTTLPPLSELSRVTKDRRMRGLIGGASPGYRDHSIPCTCGRATRTAVRLMGQSAADPAGVRLRPATVQVCLQCDKGQVYRGSAPTRQQPSVRP